MTNSALRTMEIVLQDLVIVLEASAPAWSALAHTVDSNSVEGRLCTLNYKKIPELLNMAQLAVERPWIRHRKLISPTHPHIHTLHDPTSNRHDRFQDSIKICDNGTSQHS